MPNIKLSPPPKKPPKQVLETPAFLPVSATHDGTAVEWKATVPSPNGNAGDQVYRGHSIETLIQALQRAQFHATFFLNLQKAEITILRDQLKQKTDLLTKILHLERNK